MDEERFNMSMWKFLKEVGVTSQHVIEQVVREKGLGGKGRLAAKTGKIELRSRENWEANRQFGNATT